MRWAFRLLAAAVALTAGLGNAQQASPRYALVIGNADYRTPGWELVNPVNDATLIAARLRGLGFQVTPLNNATKVQMETAMNAFAARVEAGGTEAVGVFYYAGHGVEHDGANLLVPVDITAGSMDELRYQAPPMQFLLRDLARAGNKVNVIILDACRNVPLPAGSRAGPAGGLADLADVPDNVLIAYATRPGLTAPDNPGETNSVFTRTLSDALASNPSDTAVNLFSQVQARVFSATGRAQRPEFRSGLLRAPDWRFAPVLPVLTRPALAASPAQSDRTGQIIKDCGECPELVVLPGGTFRMGSNRQADERPVRDVTLGSFAIGTTEVTVDQWKAFQPDMGVMLSSTDCDWRNPGFQQEGNHPVVCVTWNDARSYAAWLTELTGRKYFLPSEAQWEYAARAGSELPYPWGGAARRDRLNYGVDDSDECDLKAGRGGCPGRAAGGDRWVHTAPVKSFPANAFGIYDMHGNVREWTQDCHFTSYDRAPTDGGPYNPSTCGFRVMRGGSFKDIASSTTSTFRNMRPATQPEGVVGFRIAREIR